MGGDEGKGARIAVTDDGPVALYDGDVGYAHGDPTLAGSRHRLEMRDGGWRYLRDEPIDP